MNITFVCNTDVRLLVIYYKFQITGIVGVVGRSAFESPSVCSGLIPGLCSGITLGVAGGPFVVSRIKSGSDT